MLFRVNSPLPGFSVCCVGDFGGSHGAERVLPPSPLTQRIDDDASIHDRLLWAIHLSGMDDLLLFLSSSSAEQQWSLHVLEIVSLMFRDQVSPAYSSAPPAPSLCSLSPGLLL